MKTAMTLEAGAALMSEIAISLTHNGMASNVFNSATDVLWSVQLNPEPSDVHLYHYLLGSNGVRLHVQLTGYGLNDRIKISYTRPRDSQGSYCEVWDAHTKVDDPSIYVSASKLSNQIAKDINRRLLADAFYVHALVTKSIAMQDLHLNKQAELYADVCTVCGVENKAVAASGRFPNVDPFAGLSARGSFKFGYGSVVVNSNSGDITLNSVPTALLPKLLIVIRAAIENHAAGKA